MILKMNLENCSALNFLLALIIDISNIICKLFNRILGAFVGRKLLSHLGY